MKRLQGFFYLAALLSVMLAFGCKKQLADEDAVEVAERRELLKYASHDDCGDPLCGNWQWIETSAPLAPPYDHRTPETTGRRQALCLLHDSTWRWILDGKLMDTGWYTTSRKVARSVWGKAVEEPYDEIRFFSAKADSIDFSQYCNDGLFCVDSSPNVYYLDSSKLHFADLPGAVGGATYTFKKL